MNDFENAFGYDSRIPDNIREIFMWLCQDVAALQSKWDFYLELYGNEETTALLSELASWSFNIIEESLRNDMTMAICRLSDPSITMHKENLSLATLVEKCSDIAGLGNRLVDFQVACQPISKWRNKQVGHHDLHTRISPRENPLPGINKNQVNEIIKQASDILSVVAFRYTGGELNFHTVSRGGAEDLIFWLKSGQEHYSSA
jgi:HEPN superfamily AbiU2-like protein